MNKKILAKVFAKCPKAKLAREITARAQTDKERISKGAISQWTRIPDARVNVVSEITGIPPEELRPDLSKLFRSEQ